MRPFLSLGFLIALCSSANAATDHYQHRKHPVTRPDYPVVIMSPVPYGAYAGALWCARRASFTGLLPRPAGSSGG